MNIQKKSGMVAIIGRSNVGKSTLINALTGKKIAIVTQKPQTTRHLIQGVYDDERGQIVFIDTPGFFLRTKDILSKKMLERVKDAMIGVDAIIYLMDPTRAVKDEERKIASIIRNLKIPIFCVINKIDLPQTERPYMPDYYELCEDISEPIEISALKAKHIKSVINRIFDILGIGEPLYDDPKMAVDGKHWLSEIIREKIFNTFGDELPYGIYVKIDNIEETPKIIKIEASILTNNQRHKGMIIGKGGRKLKEIGTSARQELEVAAQKKIFLELSVKVDEKWMERYE